MLIYGAISQTNFTVERFTTLHSDPSVSKRIGSRKAALKDLTTHAAKRSALNHAQVPECSELKDIALLFWLGCFQLTSADDPTSSSYPTVKPAGLQTAL